MKITLVTLSILLVFVGNTFAQKKKPKESFFVFDKNWVGTTLESAVYLLRVQKQNDTCWQYDYYNFNGPLIKTLQFRDGEGKNLHGSTRYYSANGYIDSLGSYVNGEKHGDFVKLSVNGDTVRYQTLYKYEKDVLISTKDMQAPNDTSKNNTGMQEAGKESEYPGGIGKWQAFLNKNLRYPDRAVKGNFQGRVEVVFIVDADGKIENPYIRKSVEFSLDDESIRMIQLSGKWKPALKNGQPVKSYKVQPIGYRLN